MDTNEGIIQHGGTLNAGNLAVGKNAQAYSTIASVTTVLQQRGQGELAARLADFNEALAAEGESLSGSTPRNVERGP